MTKLESIKLSDYELEQSALDELLSPALLIYLDKVKENLKLLIELAGVERLRPHIKTSKIGEVFSELISAGITRFKCATTREAQVMLKTLDAHGLKGDLLVAYPHVGPALKQLALLQKEHPNTSISVLCEDPTLAQEIPETLGIMIDLNAGMNRTGVPMKETDRIAQIARASKGRLRGLHHYEGHINHGAPQERREKCHALYEPLLDLLGALQRDGFEIPELITSGTPSFKPALDYAPFKTLNGTVHRVSPGTIVYFDHRSLTDLQELNFVPAALVMSRVISHPLDDMLTCDAGSKALAAEAGDPCAVALGHPELFAQRPSEEHLPFLVGTQARPARGEPLLLFPRHICPTVNLAEEAVLIEKGKIKACVPVQARAHALRLSSAR